MMNDDMDLLRDYAARQSEQAFATLVARHVNLVHSAALRQVRDPELAGEITQTVFIILARKAAALSAKTILSGWLYRTAQFVAKRRKSGSAAGSFANRRLICRPSPIHRRPIHPGSNCRPCWTRRWRICGIRTVTRLYCAILRTAA